MAITERYVTTTGAGAHDGTSEANAFSWAEMITDINTPRVGYRYNVKQGTYSLSATTTLTGDGTTTSPNIIRGYKTTIGDATIGRASGGTIDVSNMPTISYSSGFYLNANTADYLILEALVITGTQNGTRIVRLSNNSFIAHCKITNNGTGAAYGIESDGGENYIINCDVFCPSATTSGAIGADVAGAWGCRISVAGGGIGLRLLSANRRMGSVCNTIYGCGIGISDQSTQGRLFAVSNTIANCSSDGILISNTTTTPVVAIANHITGCGGWGINCQTSTCQKLFANNRFRDNTSGNVNGGTDWEAGTAWLRITTDDADATDFTNAAAYDFSLLTTAPGIVGGIGYRNPIGAHGAGSFGSGGGGALFLGGLGQTGIGAF